MATIELKVARIGNSRCVRLPATTLARYGIGERVLMEERTDGILLRRAGRTDTKLSWEETALEMSRSEEDWSVWDGAAADGVDTIPWNSEAREGRRKKR